MVERILCIDDEEDLLEILSDFLEGLGYEVHAVSSAAKAFHLIEKDYEFDLILCDISMPEMDGYEFLRLLRSEYNRVNIPFIFLTAMADKDHMLKALELGCDEYLIKPVSFDVLESMVASRICRLRQVREHYDDSHRRISQWLFQSVAEELAWPINSILMASSQIQKHNEAKEDSALLRHCRAITQHASKQMQMFQQLDMVLYGAQGSEELAASYIARAEEVAAHTEAMIAVQSQPAIQVGFVGDASIALSCDPFLLAKSFAGVITAHKNQEDKAWAVEWAEDAASGGMCWRISCDESARGAGRLASGAQQIELKEEADLLPLRDTVQNQLLAILFALQVARAHEATLSIEYADGRIAAYRVVMPASRVMQDLPRERRAS